VVALTNPDIVRLPSILLPFALLLLLPLPPATPTDTGPNCIPLFVAMILYKDPSGAVNLMPQESLA